jgi:hypothetical protein
VHGRRISLIQMASLLAVMLMVAGGAAWVSPDTPTTSHTADKRRTSAETPQSFPVVVNRPQSSPRVDLGVLDGDGQPASAACATCHATRIPNLANRSAADFDEFHQGLAFSHGKLTCLACHNGQDYDALKLADGTSVEFPDVMTLCGQCHGPQTRDYLHGSHGGMNGFWDLSRGPRTRNNCVDCHDPHAPQFPKMTPTFKPRDRFLTPQNSAAASHEGLHQ